MKKKETEPVAHGADKAPTFERSELLAHAQRLFNTSPEVVAGALFDVTEPITIDQAREKVNSFLTRPVNEGGN